MASLYKNQAKAMCERIADQAYYSGVKEEDFEKFCNNDITFNKFAFAQEYKEARRLFKKLLAQ